MSQCEIVLVQVQGLIDIHSMVTNALKEAKLTATLCRISPPSSPSKARIYTMSSTATTSSKPRSKLLAALDAEIPNWLAAPSPTVATPSGSSKLPFGVTNTCVSILLMHHNSGCRAPVLGFDANRERFAQPCDHRVVIGHLTVANHPQVTELSYITGILLRPVNISVSRLTDLSQ